MATSKASVRERVARLVAEGRITVGAAATTDAPDLAAPEPANGTATPLTDALMAEREEQPR